MYSVPFDIVSFLSSGHPNLRKEKRKWKKMIRTLKNTLTKTKISNMHTHTKLIKALFRRISTFSFPRTTPSPPRPHHPTYHPPKRVFIHYLYFLLSYWLLYVSFYLGYETRLYLCWVLSYGHVFCGSSTSLKLLPSPPATTTPLFWYIVSITPYCNWVKWV